MNLGHQTESPAEKPEAAGVPFESFQKLARWSRNIVITEKIDGTNAQIYIGEDGDFLVGSRSRWITVADDNHGFARWALEHRGELMALGPGRHFGEWWGAGIQRRYGLAEKRFSLFNSGRWTDDVRPGICHVVPQLYVGPNTEEAIVGVLEKLTREGSVAAPGFMDPEGIVIYHSASGESYKKTIKKDEVPKGMA